ncbi:hypothetical protein ACETAC_02835 [Aceticella autotrophica]|uniref:Lipoprotein n=1 Tax=Aceticella autotrophica TaxID=2755338 RepID=A0A975AWN7_9THEO|nr:hypothetical protein [Aceticella autotrophica]QSZ27840.1 hypothetical protein ACETAC_02835 [Aceticella autotrophica]
MKRYFKSLSAILVLLFILLPSGCQKKQKNPIAQKTQTAQKPQLPKELKKIEQDIDSIIKETQKMQNMPPQQAQKEKEKNEKGKEKEGKKTSKEGQNEKQEEKQAPQEKSWNTISQTVKDIHTNWNALNPIAVKAGAKPNLIDNMSTAINNLTISVEEKSLNDIMIKSNNVYKYIPDLEDMFKTLIPPDLKRLKYYNRNILFNTYTDDWDTMSKDIINLNAIWKSLKPKLPKEAKHASDKFEAGLTELEKAVKSKNKTIAKVKSEILEIDIKSLESTIK